MCVRARASVPEVHAAIMMQIVIIRLPLWRRSSSAFMIVQLEVFKVIDEKELVALEKELGLDVMGGLDPEEAELLNLEKDLAVDSGDLEPPTPKASLLVALATS